MCASIADVVRQFKQAWARQLDDGVIERACRDAGMTWRDRLLTPATTVRLFLLQILHGNTACAHLPHLAGMAFTAAAYCAARRRLPLAALETLLARTTGQLGSQMPDSALWRGHRVLLVDGSSFSMPDTPELQRHFGQPGGQRKGCGFPVAHWLCLMHAGSGLILKMLSSPLRTHDMSQAARLHPELRAGDVLVADRAFCSFAHIALLCRQGMHGVFRLHQRSIVDFTPGRPHAPPHQRKGAGQKGLPRSRWIKSLGASDQLVEWLKPAARPSWMSAESFAALPASLVLRELRYEVRTKGFRVQQVTLLTTLLDESLYPSEALADLYGRRWRIETNFRHIKTTMGMDVLSCRSVEGVLKELTVFVLVYNLVRHVMIEASKRQDVPVDRISFIDALRWLAHARPGDALTDLVVNPARPGRCEPRVHKRRPKQYPLMRTPRAEWRKTLEAQPVPA